ncbi:low molecular weight phosphotyrosine protein phosphatase [Roseibium sp. TrichSKD4]|uniref:arsenate reductase ArsC n=1 Tax=Roseibium sp. TrichSKD4 TaxID=744980 RepID=UPI0001E56EA1|nr:arsenate reductase ArsC [Roseibium sp. TrichSKD4]EFO31594.1 low molecular weight phosphotyrosine protein phosphatase [Roseibium sp. TrichSKD4]
MRNVLFVCTANSARSVLGEALLRHKGEGRFQTYSAGSTPRGTVNPDALTCLQRHGLPTEGFRSKSWDEFSEAGGPEMDLIITVCDSAAGEVCPVWLGHPMVVHWGIPDPASAEGDNEKRGAAFDFAYEHLSRRIDALLELGDGIFSASDGRAQVNAIGQIQD